MQLTGKQVNGINDEDQDEIDRAIDIDFVVDAGAKKKSIGQPQGSAAPIHKPKRYFSAKPPLVSESQHVETPVISLPPESKQPQASKKKLTTNHGNDWILTEKEEKKKPGRETGQGGGKKLLFEVYRGGEVYRTQHSTHEKAHESYSWNMMFEMMSGKYKDNDFEPNMSNIVGHRRTKTEKDKVKL